MAKNELPQGLLASIRSGVRAGDGGRPLEVRLDLIAPDPNQPRKNIEPSSLEALAETIRRYGVLQPIVIRKSDQAGQWVIEIGERRWRAAMLAGLKTIPAYEAKARQGRERAPMQVIENQHRAALTNSELAGAIEALTAELVSVREIAIICGIHEQQVKLYRSLLKLPASLAPWADRLDVRTVYELYLAWQKASRQGREVIERRLAAIDRTGTLTLTDARRVIKSITCVPSVRSEDGRTAVAVPEEEVSVPGPEAVEREGDIHLQEDAKVLSAQSVNDVRAREGEGARLRSLIGRLLIALEDAVTALDATNHPKATELRRRVQEAKDEIHGRRTGDDTAAVLLSPGASGPGRGGAR
jgi:ParB/RepB/Spo0J family partition protein